MDVIYIQKQTLRRAGECTNIRICAAPPQTLPPDPIPVLLAPQTPLFLRFDLAPKSKFWTPYRRGGRGGEGRILCSDKFPFKMQYLS